MIIAVKNINPYVALVVSMQLPVWGGKTEHLKQQLFGSTNPKTVINKPNIL